MPERFPRQGPAMSITAENAPVGSLVTVYTNNGVGHDWAHFDAKVVRHTPTPRQPNNSAVIVELTNVPHSKLSIGSGTAVVPKFSLGTELIPAAFSSGGLESKEINLRGLPQLQKVTLLTLLLLTAKEYSYVDTDTQIVDAARADLDKVKQKTGKSTPDLNLADFVAFAPTYLKTFVTLHDRDREDIPEILAQNITSRGNPFGLPDDVVRATLEMANTCFEQEVLDSEIHLGAYEPGWTPPSPVEYLDGVLERMFEMGRWVGTVSSKSRIHPGSYYPEIFTPEARAQMQDLMDRKYAKFRRRRIEG